MKYNKNENYFGLIMAGGQGTRFWPWSTPEKPKQFLNIVGEDPLITQTYNRLKDFIAEDHIYIVADGKYLDAVKEAIPGFRDENYIAEPMPKNTAPCLILSNIVLSQANSEGRVAVVPADHYIPDRDVFARQFLDALEFAGQKSIITSGIQPTMPHTGYGYIQFDNDQTTPVNETNFHKVIEFKEKPPIEIAKEYVTAGNYYWNSGIFVYKLSHFKSLLEEYSPYYFEKYVELENAYPDQEASHRVFSSIEPESIDYALMEKVKEVKMFKAAFSWNDVGAWSSVYELNAKDDKGNAAIGEDTVFIDSRDSLIFSRPGSGGQTVPVALIGLDHVTVIHTENGILVAATDKLQEVKNVSKKLKH